LRLPNAATEGGLNNPSSGQALPLNLSSTGAVAEEAALLQRKR
jgi:hypothetical protein